MKKHMQENIATPSASQGAIVTQVAGQVQMALPKRASLSRVLRRHRTVQRLISTAGRPLPPVPRDLNFEIPQQFQGILLHDSGAGADRMLVFGSRDLLPALERATLWLADGTFKVVPTLFYQLYTIHFEFVGGINPVGVYCLLKDKSRQTYDRLLVTLLQLVPQSNPQTIVTDFEISAMNAFQQAFPRAEVSGCYFHLCQSVLRKVNEVGLKAEYESNDEITGFIRCITALSHVPAADVVDAFDILVQQMPRNEKVEEVATYFERTYVRGRRRPGRGEHYNPPIFPVAVWNKFDAAGDGIARTTNSVEGWHYSLQSLFMCQHPTMWTFLAGIQRDSQLHVTNLLQSASGMQHVGKKKYRDLKERVARTVASYGQGDLITYLRAVAFLSHS
jgi:hypothetical protein